MSTNSSARAIAADDGSRARRAGSMTTAMRATLQPSGPRVLRIGRVVGGKVVEERVMKQRVDVTVGSSPDNVFIATGEGVADSMTLFARTGADARYVLHLDATISGRVALASGVTDLAQARANGTAKRVGNGFQLALSDDARGKVVVGDTTLLFQFVTAAPAQPKAQLPLAVRAGSAPIDWGFTIIAALSFLAHFGFAGAANSDWFDATIDEDAATVAMVREAQNRPPIEPESQPTEPTQPTQPTTKRAPDVVATREPTPTRTPSTPAHDPSSEVRARSDAAASALNRDLTSIGLGVLGTLDRTGPSTAKIMRGDESAADTGLDEEGKKDRGIDTTGGLRVASASGPLSPTGGRKCIACDDTRRPGPASTPGGADAPAPKLIVPDPTLQPSVGPHLAGADAVIAKRRYRFKQCLTTAMGLDPAAGGTIKVRLNIGETGDLTATSVDSSDASPALTACIQSAFSGLKFEAPDGGATAIVVPVVLKAR